MAKTLIPSEFKTHLIDQFIESINEAENNNYYAFIGDHLSTGSTEEEVVQPVQNYQTIQVSTYRNMLIGKKMEVTDIQFMVNRHDWESGTVYQMYDDAVTDLLDTNFFTVVDENAYKHVYKCLYNANGAPSTSKPLFKDAKYDADLYTAGDGYYETTDGYQWKYLYSIDSATFTKFATQRFIPLTANTTIEQNAVSGSIDVIKIESHGKNYNNSKSGQFIPEDLNRITPTIAENAIPPLTDPTKWYRIREASQVQNFYANTVMTLTSGTGAGQYRSITESRYVTGVGVVVKVADQWEVAPDETTTFELAPRVRIVGNGNETVKATARAVINANASNSIHRIEMLEVGADYTWAMAEVLHGAPADENLEQSGVLIETTPAAIRPIISPQTGHGSNTAIELGASKLAMYMRFNRDETSLIKPENTFGQFGIIRDPLFANVEIYFTSASGQFISGETVEQIKYTELQGTWQANTSVLERFVLRTDGPTDNYNEFLDSGDLIYIRDTQSGSVFLTSVAEGSNTTAISVADDISFLEAGNDYDVQVYLAKSIGTAIVDNINPPVAQPGATAITVNKCTPTFVIGETLYGHSSKVTAAVSGIDINNRINSDTASFNFSDFNQLLKIQGTTTDTFYNDERVRQVSTQEDQVDATAYIHSWDENVLNLTNVVGDFETGGNQITGDTSDGIFQSVQGDTLDITYGDLDPNSGAIIYVQNDVPVTREANQSEEIRVILEF